MISDAEGTNLFAFPHHHMKMEKDRQPKQTGREVYEEFAHSSVRVFNFTQFAPSRGVLVTAGHADSIIYISDNVIYPGDKKERDQLYHHCFDDGKKPVFKYGDGYIISNLKMPASNGYKN